MNKAPDRYIQDLFPNVKYQEVRNLLGRVVQSLNLFLLSHCTRKSELYTITITIAYRCAICSATLVSKVIATVFRFKI